MTPTQLGPVQTLAIALIALQLGYFLTKKVDSLRKLYIPAPVVGGLLVALVTFLMSSAGFSAIKFDPTLQPLFFAGFFASIGFRAGTQLLREGLPKASVFLGITIIVAALQKLLALFLAPALGLSKAAGLLVGSGHMGGVALQSLAVPVMTNQGSVELMPILGGVATLGLLLGGFLGGPLYALLTKGVRNKPANPPAMPPVNPPAMLKHLCAYFVVVALGLVIGPKLAPGTPFFAVALVAASIWRITDDSFKHTKLELQWVNVLGNVSLSICLVVAFMNLDFGKLAVLPAGAYLLVAVQIALVLAVSGLLVYRVFGHSTFSAMVAAGLPGFAIGMPPNTMATLQNIQEQNSPMPLVTFVVPFVGAWIITFINPWIFNWVASLL